MTMLFSTAQRLLQQTLLAASLSLLLCWGTLLAQPITDAQGDVVIGGIMPDPSAILDLQSTTKGFLMPRMTDVQRDAITSPATGLAVYNTDSNAFQVNTGTTTAPVWETILTDSTIGDVAWQLGGNLSPVSNIFGTLDGTDIDVRTNNVTAITISGTDQSATFSDNLIVEGNSTLGDDAGTDQTAIAGEVTITESDGGVALLVDERNDGAGVRVIERGGGDGVRITENGNGDGLVVVNNDSGNAITSTGRVALVGSASALSVNGTDGNVGEILVSSGNGSTPSWESGNGLFWELDGNSGTTAGTNYLGTTDAEALHLYVNGGTSNSLILNTNGSLQHGLGGNARGVNAVDMQINRSANTQVASGFSSTVGGGALNTASASYSTVGAGFKNSASDGSSTVSGGAFNSASGINSTVGGGAFDSASGDWSTVGGGTRNSASGNWSTVSGGAFNSSSGNWSTVGGGTRNSASGDWSTVSGGAFDSASGDWSTVGGGTRNSASGNQSTVGGGIRNRASDSLSTVGGGSENEASDKFSTVGGGTRNTASGFVTTIGGGVDNIASGRYSTVGGGSDNAASDTYSTVGGGFSDTASAFGSTVSGGVLNVASGTYSTVGGGRINRASGTRSTVGGGSDNIASGSRSTVGGGDDNVTSGSYSAVPGGRGMVLDSDADGSFGFLGGNSAGFGAGPNTMTINTPDVAVFGNTDLWLANNDNAASQLRFYEAYNTSGAFPSGTNYTSFEAGVQTVDINYTLPLSTTATGTIADGILQLDAGTGELSWVDPTALAGTNGWDLTGNAGTTPGTNFVGTTGAQALHMYVNSGTDNSLILNTNGSLQHGLGGNVRGDSAVDLQINRSSSTEVASGPYSTVGGGLGNTASGGASTVGGGQNNMALHFASTVSGGDSNTASGHHSTIGGGLCDTASGRWSTVGGGRHNIATNSSSTVGGGTGNAASGVSSTVGGGQYNIASHFASTIDGGERNTASESHATVGGGWRNTASGVRSTVSGGDTNTASHQHSTVGGGLRNTASSIKSTVSGGERNAASNWYSTVGGGVRDTASGRYSTVSGGSDNTASGDYSTVSGGQDNSAIGDYSIVSGGRGMELDADADGSFGFLGGNSGSNDMTISTVDVAVFGNTDLWLANNNNSASQLRFYEANNTTGTFPPATTFYSSFEAGNQTADINYVLPTTLPTAGQILQASGVAGTTVTLTWAADATSAERDGEDVPTSIASPNTLNDRIDALTKLVEVQQEELNALRAEVRLLREGGGLPVEEYQSQTNEELRSVE